MDRKGLLRVVVIGVFTLGLAIGVSSAEIEATTEKGTIRATEYGKGYRFDKNGWIYVHIEGEPYERGFQHGYLVASELDEILESLKYLTYWNTGKDWEFFVEKSSKRRQR